MVEVADVVSDVPVAPSMLLHDALSGEDCHWYAVAFDAEAVNVTFDPEHAEVLTGDEVIVGGVVVFTLAVAVVLHPGVLMTTCRATVPLPPAV